MSGTLTSTTTTFATGDQKIDGILEDSQWVGPITYNTPASATEYTAPYGDGEEAGFFTASASMDTVMAWALDISHGNSANDGFSVEGFTNLDISATTGADATIRVAQTTLDPYDYDTAWGYYPWGGESGGDVWFTTDGGYDYTLMETGNYEYLTMIHELGHALGLEHGHSSGDYGAVPSNYDAMEYTVMTYRSYLNDPLSGGYSNETWGYAQTYMMLDIAALQHKYGADYTTNSGDTVYSWTPGSGNTLVDGVAGIIPGGNRIFATIWDGGGEDTYDLSAYTDAVQIDLAPGGSSLFSATQQANLGDGNFAEGNIYNALLHDGDLRSLIENAIGGNGDDTIDGNAADNELLGKTGHDTMDGADGNDEIHGQRGNDWIYGGTGRDILVGGFGDDVLIGNYDKDQLFGGVGDDVLKGRHGTDYLVGDVGNDTIEGGSGADLIEGNGDKDSILGGSGDDTLLGGAGTDVVSGDAGSDLVFGGGGADLIYGGDGYDELIGGDGGDTLIGGGEGDVLTGGSGADHFVFNSLADSQIGPGEDLVTDFEVGVDKIDLSTLAPGLTVAIGGGLTGTGPSARTAEAGGHTAIYIDFDGDGGSDMRITLGNVTGVTEGDFIL